jgi:DNA-binding SARP family transcriptional activator
LQLHLLGEFSLVHRRHVVPAGSATQRLLAYLALTDGPVRRTHVAGALWLCGTASQASANLRAVLCRLPRPGGRPLVQSDGTHVHLARHIDVDLARAQDRIRRVRTPGPLGPLDPECPQLLSKDLLPAWDDDWLIVDRERHRQLRLHALEDLSQSLCGQGRYDEALTAALAAVAGEPLRESSHRRVIEVHLAERNAAEALRQYESYRRMLREELGLPPSDAIRSLVAHLLGRPTDVGP